MKRKDKRYYKILRYHSSIEDHTFYWDSQESTIVVSYADKQNGIFKTNQQEAK